MVLLVSLFRRTLDNGTVPTDGTVANEIPLYKKRIKVLLVIIDGEPYINRVQGIGKYHKRCHYGALRTTQTE